MNITKIKKGNEYSFINNNIQWKSKLNIKDGEYKIGIRPHNITTYKREENSIRNKRQSFNFRTKWFRKFNTLYEWRS